MEKQTIWTTKRVNEWMSNYSNGIVQSDSPWMNNQIGIRKPDIVFEYTPYEIQEITRCSQDVVYFANTYCHCLQGSKGYQQIILRDYQTEMLESYTNHRFCITVSTRQIGKCCVNNTIQVNSERVLMSDLMYSGDQTILSKIKSVLLRWYNKQFLKNIILFLIEMIERWEYRGLDLDEHDIHKKIIESRDISNQGLQVESHDGYHPITHVHKTQPFTIFTLKLENGATLECADKHVVFTEGLNSKFVKDLDETDYIITDQGLSKVKSISKSRFKVSMYDISVDSKEHSYFSNGILSHNTVTAGVFLLHQALFNVDKNIGVTGNKHRTAIEIVDKIKEMMDRLPFFLKQGMDLYNQSAMTFSNGCRIIAQATTKRSFIGFAIHVLYLDEFAHIEPEVLNEFYENIMPTISSMDDSKIIITSTPNGCNKFYDIYKGACDGTNSYHPTRVDWWQVPGRDEEWHKKMIADCGGEDEFMRQYGNSFLATGNMLLTPETLKHLQETKKHFEYRELQAIESNFEEEFRKLIWDPDFDIESLHDPDCRFVIGCDIAEGGGKKSDNTVFQIAQILPKDIEIITKQTNTKMADLFKLKQVGMFRSNTSSIDISAKLLYILVQRVFTIDNVFVVLEYNTYGSEMIRALEKVFDEDNEWDNSVFVKYKHSADSIVKKPGLRLNGQNKSVYCVQFRGLCSNHSIEFTEIVTVTEAEVFSKVGNSYRANGSTDIHDDTMMALIDMSTIIEQDEYKNFMYDILEVHQELRDYFYNVYSKEAQDVPHVYNIGDSSRPIRQNTLTNDILDNKDPNWWMTTYK